MLRKPLFHQHQWEKQQHCFSKVKKKHHHIFLKEKEKRKRKERSNKAQIAVYKGSVKGEINGSKYEL